MIDDSLSITDAAQRYGISRSTLDARIRQGQIPAHKVRGPHGREWRVTPADLEEFGYRLGTVRDAGRKA